MSIFGKDCPRCGETNAAYAVSCRCGFAFNSVDHVEEEESDISVTIQEEELYLEYLTARAQQAAETSKNAASAAAAQPANKVAASQAQQAQVAADQAKAELEQQRARMKVTINGLADDRPGAPEQPVARPEQPASAAPARPASSAFSTTPTNAPAKPVTAPPVGERKQPATAAVKPAVAPLGVERKEPAPAAAKPSGPVAPESKPTPPVTVKSSGPPATEIKPTPPVTVKSSGPAAPGSKPTPPAGATTPQDLNRYVPGADNARAATTGHSADQATGHPASSQTKIPTGPASARPETKVQASASSATNKVVPPAAKTSATQAMPTKPEHVPASRQPAVSNASDTARPASSGHKNAGAGPQAPRSPETSNKPATQGDAAAKAAAAAARAKQLAEALKAAQAERAAKAKTSATTPSLNSKTGQEKPAASSESSAVKVRTPVQTPRAAAASSGAAVTSANPANGQQHKLNGHDKPYADINAIPIPGTALEEITLESDEAVSKQVASAPETVAEQPSTGTVSSNDRPTQKNGTPRPVADSEKAAPAKPVPGVTVTVTPGADPQEELEAALKALSVRAPAPPASGLDKAPADTKDAAVSPEIGDNPAPAAAPTPAPDDGLPSLEPVTPANQKDCPNCTALLPMDAKRCRCGFRFPEIEETMPGLSLSDSDFAALDGDTSSAGITHLS